MMRLAELQIAVGLGHLVATEQGALLDDVLAVVAGRLSDPVPADHSSGLFFREALQAVCELAVYRHARCGRRLF